MAKRKHPEKREVRASDSSSPVWHFAIAGPISLLGGDFESLTHVLHGTFTTLLNTGRGSTVGVGYDAALLSGQPNVPRMQPRMQPASLKDSSGLHVLVDAASAMKGQPASGEIVCDGVRIEVFLFCAGEGKRKSAVIRRLKELITGNWRTPTEDNQRSKTVVAIRDPGTPTGDEPRSKTMKDGFVSQIQVGRAHNNQ